MATSTIYLVGNGTSTITPTSTATWTVEAWGAGQSGNDGTGAGGTGGSWAEITNFAATEGTPVSFELGAPGLGTSGGVNNGGDTWLSNTGAQPTTTTQGVLAPGGGSTTTAVGTTVYAGGVGGGFDGGTGGGGGAGGPGGAGKDGGAGAADTGGGGGGNGGGTAGGNGAADTGGAGGNGVAGTGGAGGAANAGGGAGGAGSGGGGGGYAGTVTTDGGAGGNDFDNGGGGAGGGALFAGSYDGIGGNGGTPGGGGADSTSATSPTSIGRGGWSVIKITFTSDTASTQTLYFGTYPAPTTTTATAAVAVGALTAASVATSKNVATGAAATGAITAAGATAAQTNRATGAASLGAMLAAAKASFSTATTAVAGATLGALTAAATITQRNTAAAAPNTGALTAAATVTSTGGSTTTTTTTTTTTAATVVTGSQSDFVGRIRAALPKRWFPTSPENGPSATPILDGILNGLAAAWAWLYSLYSDCYTQGRIATATLVNLDMIALDFFGVRVMRGVSQSDTSFRLTIQQNLLAPRGTRAGVSMALQQLTGKAPWIFEPANPSDTGGYTLGGVGYGVAGGYGNLNLPYQCFLTAYRPVPSATGLANVAGWGNPQSFNIGAGGWRGGAIEWGNTDMVTGLVTDAMIQQCVVNNQLCGTVVWMNISD